MNEIDARRKILNLFRKNEGDFVSGEEISRVLGFSRASVWKYVSKLREDGYVVDAVPRKGYRIRRTPDRMLACEIANGLQTDVIGKRAIFYYERITSTNDRAYELAEAGESEGAVIIAETQTRGKGRLGRKWLSPVRGGIYMSLILRPDAEPDEIPAITLIAASGIIKAVKKVSSLGAKMKWPNDILLDGKKICGILTEIKAQPDRVDFVVLGIGINVNSSEKKLPHGATSLREKCGKRVNRLELARKVFEEFEKNYLRFKEEGFVSLRDECKTFSSVLGKRVKVVEHHRDVEGVAWDIDEKGALIIKTGDDSFQRVFSGDIVMCR